MIMMMAKEVSQALAQRAEEVARYLLPNGKKDGNEWRIGSIHGEKGQSLAIHLCGEKAGVWCDFASEDKGDLLDLWSAVRKIKLSEAAKEAMRYLGVTHPKFDAHRPPNFVRPKVTLRPTIPNSAVMNYLINERKLSAETIYAFQIGENGRDIVFYYLRDNELILVKYTGLDRPNNKKQIRIEANCEPCLFGWQAYPEIKRKLILTEGEIDAMSWYQYGFFALSVPFGGGGGKKQAWLEHEFDNLSMFDEIYLSFDPDPAGQTAIKELIDRIGRHRCRIIKLPYKDANECLQAGVTKEQMQKCVVDASSLDPDELKSASIFAEQVIAEFYPPNGEPIGISPPWDKAQNKILFRPDELSVWTGINGHGKSQFLGQVILHSMKQGARVCIASLELKPKRLLMRLARQATGLKDPSERYIHDVHNWYQDKLWLFDLVGTAKSKRLLEVFLYARQRYGIDIFVIDSFMKLDIAEDDYKAQKAFIEQLCDFKNQYNCHIHIIVHPRKSADESQAPGKLDNKGTGAITDLADNCFSVWRNKKKEDLIRKQLTGGTLSKDELDKIKASDCIWSCDKQRNGDWEGKLGFWFHPDSLQYLANESKKPVAYVEFSPVNQG